MLKAIELRHIVQQIGQFLFFLLILVSMLDPSNSLLHLKEKIFLLCLGFNLLFFKPDFRFLLPLLSVFAVLFLGYVLAQIQGNPIDEEYLQITFKGLAPLFLLLWVRHYDVLRIARYPALITCLIILVLYGLIASSPVIEYAVFTFSKQNNGFVMITTRNILGVKIFGMYYRSIVSIIPLLFYWLYRGSLRNYKQPLLLLVCLVMMGTFFISGTRAMMLMPLFALGVIFYDRLSKSMRIRYFLYPLFVLLIFAFLLLVSLLATQEGDQSNAIKYGHLNSYVELFSDAPQYLLWGQGIATSFYSEGFGYMTPQTEWIYIELLRNYGVFAFVIIGFFFYPLWIFYLHRKDPFTRGFALTYFAFLLIAGTNPFLLNSQGMTVLWIVYSYMLRLQERTISPVSSSQSLV